ncbi:MAG: hypothetical protein AB7F86_11395 [Bdellovibrionales bacterium]
MERLTLLALILLISFVASMAMADVTPGKLYSVSEFVAAKGPSSGLGATASAVGVIDCGVKTTAQVTGKNDVITMAGHNFFWPSPQRHCNPSHHVKSCTFQLFGSKEIYHVRMETLRASCDENRTDQDWAVAKLDRPIRNVTPLEVPGNAAIFYSGAKITTISAARDDRSVQMVQECSVYDYGIHAYYPLKTDCLTFDGFSGSAQLIEDPNGRLILGAIHIGWLGRAGGSTTFNVVNDFRYSAELKGKFLDAIQEVMALP